MGGITFNWAGQTLTLYPEKALVWEETNTLLLTDPHFGKPSAFRHMGIPIPTGTTRRDIEIMTELIRKTCVNRLIILGDFFHHRTGCCEITMEALTQWRRSHPSLEVVLVEGNHDKYSSPVPAEWDFLVADSFRQGPFLFCHKPCEGEDEFVMAGHIHPGVKLSDPLGRSLYLPCYHFGKRTATLPSFGGFTGSARISPRKGDHIFAIKDNCLYPISTR